MTKLIVKSNNDWTKKKIKDIIDAETHLLRKAILRIENKINEYEKKHGNLDRNKFYGKIDDMELLEWESELDTAQKLRGKLTSFEEIIFEYK